MILVIFVLVRANMFGEHIIILVTLIERLTMLHAVSLLLVCSLASYSSNCPS